MPQTPSFRTKLWRYFALFTAIILSMLWILQTVFLQTFYNSMMERNIRSAASKIAANSQSQNLPEIIDRLTVEDSLLVYITDEDGSVLYSSDSYKPYFRQNNRPGQNFGKDNPFHKFGEMGFQNGGFRDLPDNYQRFLEDLKESDSGTVSYTENNSYIYGCRIDLGNDETAVLYTAGALGAVGATASIIRSQLFWVTLLSLALAFLIAWLIARRFSVPISQLNEQAKLLSTDHYEDHFQEGFCNELDELNTSLSESAQKLEEARNYQKELLANVSHDLRTPLTMIRGYAEMVRDISWEDERQRNADTGIIIKEADRLTALVNEILEYSQLQEQGLEIQLDPVDLSQLTERVIGQFEALFQSSGGCIEKDIDPDCVVNGNAELLERAVYNLIDNAIRHTTNQDKRIHVTVRKGSPITLEVRDHGTGIAPEELTHIWEKYYTSRQRNHQGVSGLGLAIVRQIAVLHHAETTVESHQGQGSAFRLLFS